MKKCLLFLSAAAFFGNGYAQNMEPSIFKSTGYNSTNAVAVDHSNSFLNPDPALSASNPEEALRVTKDTILTYYERRTGVKNYSYFDSYLGDYAYHVGANPSNSAIGVLYSHTGTGTVYGIFAAIQIPSGGIAGTPDQFYAVVYAVDGAGLPTTTLGAKAFTLNDVTQINTASVLTTMTYFEFAAPVTVSGNFIVALSTYDAASSGGNDVFGICTNAQGDGKKEYKPVQFNSPLVSPANTWVTLKDFWGESSPGVFWDADPFLFPVMDASTGINDLESNGMKIGKVFPNPSAGSSSTIEYSLEKSSKQVILRVYGVDGRMLSEKELGSKTAGDYKELLPIDQLASGTYIFMLESDNARITSRFSITGN